MALIRFQRRTPAFPAYTPFANLEDLPNRIRKMFEEGLDLAPVSETLGFMPATEIVETPEELVVTAELPGLTKENIDITIDEGVLTIRGEKAEERKEGDEERKYHLWERSYGTFQRSFTLPSSVDPSKIHAAFEKGVLMVRLPKTAEAKTRGRKVEIVEKK